MWVKKWSLAASVNYEWYAEFKWQASHDKKEWIDIGSSMQTEGDNNKHDEGWQKRG